MILSSLGTDLHRRRASTNCSVGLDLPECSRNSFRMSAIRVAVNGERGEGVSRAAADGGDDDVDGDEDDVSE